MIYNRILLFITFAASKYSVMMKPYALYIHGMGSGAKSGTKSSLGRYLDQYEWLSPEVSHDPEESLAILNEWAAVFQPALIAGTSMGGFYNLFVDCPTAIKLTVNPTYNIENVMRKVGYGKHKYLCERENGETEYVIDEPLVRKFIDYRQNHEIIPGVRNIAVFSSDDELVGKENSKKNAAVLEKYGFEIVWSDKFGHRLNEKATKLIVNLLSNDAR